MSDSESDTVRVPRDNPLFSGEGPSVTQNPGRSADNLLEFVTKFTDGKCCSVCGVQATGVGDGVFYCHDHWFAAFDAMEERMSKKNNTDA